jgi:hypothetical protein
MDVGDGGVLSDAHGGNADSKRRSTAGVEAVGRNRIAAET